MLVTDSSSPSTSLIAYLPKASDLKAAVVFTFPHLHFSLLFSSSMLEFTVTELKVSALSGCVRAHIYKYSV